MSAIVTLNLCSTDIVGWQTKVLIILFLMYLVFWVPYAVYKRAVRDKNDAYCVEVEALAYRAFEQSDVMQARYEEIRSNLYPQDPEF